MLRRDGATAIFVALDGKAAGILGLARHNTVYFPNLTIKGAIQAIRVVRPWAVDVSSGVEVSPGVKDHAVTLDTPEQAERFTEYGDTTVHLGLAMAPVAWLMAALLLVTGLAHLLLVAIGSPATGHAAPAQEGSA